MALPAYRRTRNHRLTIQGRIGDSIALSTIGPDGVAAPITVPVLHSTAWGDPESVRDPSTSAERAWVITSWRSGMAGRRGVSMLQVDVFSRLGSPGAATSDPFGLTADDIADAVEDIFAGEVDAGGVLKATFRVLDYSIPAAPVETDAFLYCWPPEGGASLGSVGRRDPQGVAGGYQRVTLTFYFSIERDRLRQPYYS